MAELSKQALVVDNNQSFPNNNNGAITPSILRAFNTNIIDSTVNQTQYTVDSGSWNSKIEILNGQTGSYATTGSNTFTGNQNVIGQVSASTFVGDGSGLTNLPGQTSLTPLNDFTASQNTKNITLATYTGSNDTKWNTLGGLTGSYVTSQITGSSLVTASFSGNTLTFTKGDSSTFGVLIPDVSGSDLSSLNAFTSSQLSINAGYNTFTSSQETKNSTLATYTGSVNTFITASAQRLDLIEDATASLFLSASLALVTGSVAGNVLTFTKGDSSQFSLTVATGSGGGGTIDTGSFATTGSNNFIGDQTVTGSVNISGGEHLYIKREIGGAQQELRLGSTDNLNNFAFIVTGSDQNPGQQVWGINVGGGVWANSFDAGVVFNGYATASQGLYVGNGGGGTLNAPLQNGYVWVGNGSDRNTTAPTSSFGSTINTGSLMTTGSISGNVLTFTKGDASTFTLTVETGSGGSTDTGSLLVTASFSGNTLTFTKGDNSTFGVVIPDVSGSSINTGSFATTGSNNFKGVETIGDVDGVGTGEVYLLGRSGSLVLGAFGNTPLYSALAHLSSSQVNSNVNLIFKTNTNTADTIISGSSNIFTNPAAPTAGFKRYVGASGNIMLNASNVPQISSSMEFSPTMNNNYFGGNSTTLTMRGPVSSSTYTISGNSILGTVNVGQNATNNAEKLVSGLNLVGNQIAGNLNIIANKELLSSPFGFINNNLNGAATFNLASSSVAMANSNINDSSFTITNNAYTTAPGVGQLTISRLNAGGSGNSITAVGTGTVSSYSDNVIFGTGNALKIDLSQTNNASNGNNILGKNLIVTASGVFPDTNGQFVGTLFTGRNNALDGNRASSAQTVFAVGTGTNTTTGRKTGFLIDSGSNTFVEGTLNVSGSTTLNGNSLITGSLTVSGSATITGSVSVSNVLSLAQLDPLPGGADGQLAVSASNLYFFSGSAWNKIAFG